jgi:hypothetical protein
MRQRLLAIAATLAAIVASPAAAWGYLGHRVTALIAYHHMTPAARARLDALLASDPDTLTAPDFASRTTWADEYRTSHRETAAWHFVDIEIDSPDLATACFGFLRAPAGAPASAGPAQDCVVDKIEEFSRELSDPATPAPERLLALKFVIHFVGDLEQPLHAADHHDRGGNCVQVISPSSPDRIENLLAYWDTGVVHQLGQTPEEIAATLERQITPAKVKVWSAGSRRDWAMDSFRVAKADVYTPDMRAGCEPTPGASIRLTAAYEARARVIAAEQLEKAGVRMAAVLNRAFR